jgi:flagellar motility protein MotE (MotC chaperone)
MIRAVRNLRLVPVVLFATVSLFALKTIGLVLDGHYALDDSRAAGDPADITRSITETGSSGPSTPPDNGREFRIRSWAQQMFNFPGTTGAVGDKVAENKEPAKDTRPTSKPEEPKGTGWTPVPVDGGRPKSAAETAILERLQEHRTELEARTKDLDMRENLLKAAEKRLEARINELKDLEARINSMVQQRDENEAARLKNVVIMYENMKAKDAAKVFDRLDLKILVEVANQINPRRMSDILAQMTPEAAERLTVELATRSGVKDKDNAADLPKIEGKPPTN